MYNVECEQCGEPIGNNCTAYIYDGKIFDDTDCIVEYLYKNNSIDHVMLTSVEN